MRRFLLLFTLSLFSTMIFSSLPKYCLDRNGDPVAWFSIIKYPNSLTKTNPRHAYLDELSGDELLIINTSADSEGEALTNTIESIQKAPHIIIFNDATPSGKDLSSAAHAKGIIAYDDVTQSGVYIMHSLPKFPSVNDDGTISTKFPDSALYGQHIYCITLDKESFQHVYDSLPVERPDIYYSTGMFIKLPATSPSTSNIAQFKLINGESQYFFTKGPKLQGFLYEDLIIPHFNINVQVQSWGRPYQPPACSTNNQALNIQKINFNNGDGWDHTSDHSKWAISKESVNVQVTCFCDMNRMDSQIKRGGSCFCSNNKNLYEAFSKIVVTTDNC